ncbi:MAG: glycosyltransferase family 4 protein, partial [Candidatus Methylomirabilis sp.]|nr:glycosyltransferase family 4 protein [Deltaproteobacteria bacterium]
MDILFVNKFYHVAGGGERYMFRLKELLERSGDRVIPFSTQHARNEASVYGEFFLPEVDLDMGGKSLGEKLRLGANAVWWPEAARRMEALLKEARPELAHVHNIHNHVSPAVLPPLRRAGIPVVQTLHDYQLICPHWRFYSQGEVCESCKTHKYVMTTVRNCKGSRAASLLATIEAYAHWMLGVFEKSVDHWIAPSEFLRRKFVEYGTPESKITTLPYFIDVAHYEPNYEPGEEVLFTGRLAEGKGIETLIRAMARVKPIRLRIVGDGPLRADLEAVKKEAGADNVEFAGWIDGDAFFDAVRAARFVVVPSEWWEIFGIVAIEAFACGKPVIAARSGGLTEVVDEGETGALYEPGDADALAAAIEKMHGDAAGLREMGRLARARAAERFGP